MSNEIYTDKIIPVSSRKISIDSGLNTTGDVAISESLTATNPETGTSGSLVFSSDFTKCLGSSISGLALSNGTDTEHDITIASGYCIDSTGTYVLRLTSPITKQLDAAWTNGTNAGGMQVGSTISATTEYFAWIIRRDSDGTTDVVWSPSSTAPTLPSGYTYKRLLRGIRTNSSSNIVNSQWLITDVVNDRSATMFVSYEVAAGGYGGTATSGFYRTRPLNTVRHNEIPEASLSSNQVILPAGLYKIMATGSMYNVNFYHHRWYNVSDSVSTVLALSGFSSTSINDNSPMVGSFYISAQKTFEFQYYCSVGRTTDGLGTTGGSVATEIYSQIKIEKVG
jgi:hypothetical protein